jgi:predicted ester cyclase
MITLIFAEAADFKVEPKSWVTNDRSYALELIFTVTQKGDLPDLPATGKRFSVRGCSIREFENGKIKGR